MLSIFLKIEKSLIKNHKIDLQNLKKWSICVLPKFVIRIIVLSIFSRYSYRDRTFPLFSRFRFYLSVPDCSPFSSANVPHRYLPFPLTVPDNFPPILTVFNVKEYFLETFIIFS